MRTPPAQDLVDAGPARAHLTRLLAAGASARRIARHTHLSHSTITRIADGHHTLIQRATATRILTTTSETPDPGNPRTLVDATGTIRRKQALQALGYSPNWIAHQLEPVTTGYVKGHRVTARTATAIRDLYDQWSHQPATGATRNERLSIAKTLTEAQRCGYATPAAWAGLDIDDPTVAPRGPGTPRKPLLSAAYIATQTGTPVGVLETRPWFRGPRK